MGGNVDRDKKGKYRKRTAGPKQEIIDYVVYLGDGLFVSL